MEITIFDFPTKVIFGVGSLRELPVEARNLGKKALVVTYPDVERTGLLKKVVKGLSDQGLETISFTEVEPNPRSSTVNRGTDMARSQNIDLVIGLGGGSAMDAAKAIALALSGDLPIWSYAEKKIAPSRIVPPIIQVPTLAGTGAEISRGAVITNWETHVKKSIISPFIQARVAVIDPELTLTAPDLAVRAGAVDAFSHAVEAYITAETQAPLTDGFRETIMKIVIDYLPKMIANPLDLDVRTQLSWASTMAMSQIARLGGGGGFMPCHGLGHALSGFYNLPHGNSLAVLLPAWMKYTHPATEKRFARLAETVFNQEDAIKAFEEWLGKVGMRIRLRDTGFNLKDIKTVSTLAVNSSVGLRHNPVPIDESGAARIYSESY